MNIFDKINKLKSKPVNNNLSLPNTKEVHGIKIRKLPIGSYIKAINSLNTMPQEIILKIFPGKSCIDIFEYFKNPTEEELINLFYRLCAEIPQYFFKFLAELLEIPYEKIIDELTPAELLDVILAFWELNDMTNFLKKVKSGVIQNLINVKSAVKF